MKLTFVSLVALACLHSILALPVDLDRRGEGEGEGEGEGKESSLLPSDLA